MRTNTLLEKIHVRGRFEAKAFDPEYRCVVISVTDPEADLVRFNKFCVMTSDDILRLRFDDVDVGRYTREEIDEFSKTGGCAPMHKFHAAQIPQHLKRVRDGATRLLIHCEAGVSRSPSIAMAITDSLGLSRDVIDWAAIAGSQRTVNDEPPNMHVYNMVMEAFNVARN